MKRVIVVLAVALLPGVAAAADKPAWAFPVSDSVQPPPRIDGSRVRPAPAGSTLSITRAKADDMFDIPNWYPDMYPAMPKIVQFGDKETQTRACGSCHLPTGTGHDESAYVAGLPVAYFIRQLADWKNGERKYGGIMIALAKSATDDEIKEAASYFASVKPRQWIRVAEADTVPKSFIGPGNKRLVHPAGGTEPLGNRIIEVPENEEDVVYRDPRTGFVAYVPKGSLEKGKDLVLTGGGGKTTACITCHGPQLMGVGLVPRIAGHSPTYIVRQLAGFQVGARNSEMDQLMKDVVANLTQEDIVSLAAYISSLFPDK